MKKIEYGRYSLEELESALAAIDKERYPGNYSALMEAFEGRRRGEAPLLPPDDKGAGRHSAGYQILHWVLLVSAQAWALIGLLNGSLYIPSKKGGITFSGSSVFLAFSSITLLVVSGSFYLMRGKKFRGNQGDRNFFWFLFAVSIGLFAWACIINPG